MSESNDKSNQDSTESKEATASLSEAWFLLRQFSISATGGYKAGGMSRMVSVYHFWHHLVFDPRQKNEDNPIMAHGRNHEDHCIRSYEEITGNIKCFEHFSGNTVSEAPFRRHPNIYWLGATPDGLVEEDGLCEGRPALVECKCPFWVPYDTAPFEYLVQMFVQMAVYGIPCNYLVCWYRNRCRRVWRVHWNDDFWSYLFIRMCIFWQCVENRVSPSFVLKNTGVACEDFARANFSSDQRKYIAKAHGLLPHDLPPPVRVEIVHYEAFDPTMKPTENELAEYRRWNQPDRYMQKPEVKSKDSPSTK
jgi:hypothetical protein